MGKNFQKGLAQIVIIFLLTLGLLAALYLVRQDTSTARPKARDEKPFLPPQSQALLHIPVCVARGQDEPRCHARVVIDTNGKPRTSNFPNGLGPAQFLGAYNLGGLSANGRVLAVVVANDHPYIKSDLDTYSAAFNIPTLPDCVGPIASSSVPCFQKVDQFGGTNYPTQSSIWALETALDIEVAHGVCQDCKILLVEANGSNYFDLMQSIDTAIALGANVVSNSWGSGEFSVQYQFNTHLNVPGVAITFSSGDGGYGATYPASSQYVTAVGGTTLYVNTNNSYGSETGWAGAGSGCSAYEAKPSWQKDSACANRTIADVSADADPSTGAAIYNTVPYNGSTGWFKVGGTSLASPIIAATYALKGVPSGVQANSLPYINSPQTNLRDITSGGSGSCPKKNKYLCTAVPGYDGPTGLGTPKGADAF